MISSGGINLDEELEKFKKAGIKIHPFIWDTLYLYLADYLSVINLCCYGYIKKNEPISVNDGKKMLHYATKANDILDKLLHPNKITDGNERLDKIKRENIIIDPGVRELISHFVYNKLHAICFIISDRIDPIAPQPISIESTNKIHDYSSFIILVLEMLRKGLQEKEVGF